MLNVNLLDYFNEKNKQFMEKCINHNKECLGIYSNKLKEIAKDHQQNLEYILEEKKYQDEFMICAFMFNYIKDYEVMFKYLTSFIKEVTNWAICDSLVSSLKIIKKNKEKFLKDLHSFYIDDEFSLRFILIILKCYYLEDKYFSDILYYLDQIKADYYYVKMGKAWLLCDMLIKLFDKTTSYIKQNKLDQETKKYLERKIKDTYRLTNEQKLLIINILGE